MGIKRLENVKSAMNFAPNVQGVNKINAKNVNRIITY